MSGADEMPKCRHPHSPRGVFASRDGTRAVVEAGASGRARRGRETLPGTRSRRCEDAAGRGEVRGAGARGRRGTGGAGAGRRAERPRSDAGRRLPPGRDDEMYSRRAQPPVRATRFGNAPRARELDVLREARVRCDGRECRRSRPPRPRVAIGPSESHLPGRIFFPPGKQRRFFFFFPDRSRGSLKPRTENLPRLAILIDQKISRERRFGSAVSSISVRRETIGWRLLFLDPLLAL